MLSAASASPVSSYAAIPTPPPRTNDVSPRPGYVSIQVSNRCPSTESQHPSLPAVTSLRVSSDEVASFVRHLHNVDKAATSARAAMVSTADSGTGILGALDEARARLDKALRDFAPGFPDQLDVPLANDRSQRTIPPLLDAIEHYERQLRRVERTQARACRPLSTCATAVALSIAVGGSAIALCAPAARPTPGEDDLIHPGVRLCAALLAYIPLLSVGLHYVLGAKAATVDLREALSALRSELNTYTAANAANAAVVGISADGVAGCPVPTRSPVSNALPTPQGAARAENVSRVDSAATTTARVHDETITIEMPANGSNFLS